MRTTSALGPADLTIKSLAPTWNPFFRSALDPLAENMSTGSAAVPGSDLSRRQTSYPSISGIIISSRTNAGVSDFIFS